MRVFLFLAGEHENRTHLTVLAHGDSGFEVRDGHQLRNLSQIFEIILDRRQNGKKIHKTASRMTRVFMVTCFDNEARIVERVWNKPTMSA